jgi:transcriptional regulator
MGMVTIELRPTPPRCFADRLPTLEPTGTRVTAARRAFLLISKMCGSILCPWLPRGESRMTDSTDVIPGTLDMLILKSLSLQPMHGFGVTKRIEHISNGVFKVNPGSLLLAFQRLERAGLIDGEWRMSENNRRARYYRLKRKGRKQLEVETSDWARRVAAIARLLEA